MSGRACGPPEYASVHREELELRVILWADFGANRAGHAPVEHLMVDRDIELLFLHDVPDRLDGLVARGKVGLGGQRHDHRVDVRIREAGPVPAAAILATVVNEEVEDV